MSEWRNGRPAADKPTQEEKEGGENQIDESKPRKREVFSSHQDGKSSAESKVPKALCHPKALCYPQVTLQNNLLFPSLHCS